MTKYIFRYERMKCELFNIGYGASLMANYDGRRVFFKDDNPNGYGRIPCVKNFDAYSDYAQMDDVDVVSAHIDWCEVVK